MAAVRVPLVANPPPREGEEEGLELPTPRAVEHDAAELDFYRQLLTGAGPARPSPLPVTAMRAPAAGAHALTVAVDPAANPPADALLAPEGRSSKPAPAAKARAVADAGAAAPSLAVLDASDTCGAGAATNAARSGGLAATAAASGVAMAAGGESGLDWLTRARSVHRGMGGSAGQDRQMQPAAAGHDVTPMVGCDSGGPFGAQPSPPAVDSAAQSAEPANSQRAEAAPAHAQAGRAHGGHAQLSLEERAAAAARALDPLSPIGAAPSRADEAVHAEPPQHTGARAVAVAAEPSADLSPRAGEDADMPSAAVAPSAAAAAPPAPAAPSASAAPSEPAERSGADDREAAVAQAPRSAALGYLSTLDTADSGAPVTAMPSAGGVAAAMAEVAATAGKARPVGAALRHDGAAASDWAPGDFGNGRDTGEAFWAAAPQPQPPQPRAATQRAHSAAAEPAAQPPARATDPAATALASASSISISTVPAAPAAPAVRARRVYTFHRTLTKRIRVQAGQANDGCRSGAASEGQGTLQLGAASGSAANGGSAGGGAGGLAGQSRALVSVQRHEWLTLLSVTGSGVLLLSAYDSEGHAALSGGVLYDSADGGASAGWPRGAVGGAGGTLAGQGRYPGEYIYELVARPSEGDAVGARGDGGSGSGWLEVRLRLTAEFGADALAPEDEEGGLTPPRAPLGAAAGEVGGGRVRGAEGAAAQRALGAPPPAGSECSAAQPCSSLESASSAPPQRGGAAGAHGGAAAAASASACPQQRVGSAASRRLMEACAAAGSCDGRLAVAPHAPHAPMAAAAAVPAAAAPPPPPPPSFSPAVAACGFRASVAVGGNQGASTRAGPRDASAARPQPQPQPQPAALRFADAAVPLSRIFPAAPAGCAAAVCAARTGQVAQPVWQAAQAARSFGLGAALGAGCCMANTGGAGVGSTQPWQQPLQQPPRAGFGGSCSGALAACAAPSPFSRTSCSPREPLPLPAGGAGGAGGHVAVARRAQQQPLPPGRALHLLFGDDAEAPAGSEADGSLPPAAVRPADWGGFMPAAMRESARQRSTKGQEAEPDWEASPLFPYAPGGAAGTSAMGPVVMGASSCSPAQPTKAAVACTQPVTATRQHGAAATAAAARQAAKERSYGARPQQAAHQQRYCER